MTIVGMKELGYKMEANGSFSNVEAEDLAAMSQNGATIAVIWARLAGIKRSDFIEKINDVWSDEEVLDRSSKVTQ